MGKNICSHETRPAYFVIDIGYEGYNYLIRLMVPRHLASIKAFVCLSVCCCCALSQFVKIRSMHWPDSCDICFLVPVQGVQW